MKHAAKFDPGGDSLPTCDACGRTYRITAAGNPAGLCPACCDREAAVICNALHLAGVLSESALHVLAIAARRDGEWVFPVKRLGGFVRTSVVAMLTRGGLITDETCPVLTDLGREVAAIYLGCTNTRRLNDAKA